ncbi:MAG: tRNA (adenosine(37)-N6)-threonylcarbamoyltransferase complex transferase subunit TsaD, partial [Clostridiales bacterium]|nr:tRNA (adenosine(37)-N6)-threonylcarbamoyltransferase complex transferase subunit TsaD [Clostridiales bacterium]
MLEGKLILGIESSCDETSASVVMDGRRVLSNVISSQIELHKKFGGVVPEVASRKHVENISAVVDKAMGDADVTFKQLDSVAVTYGPGLVGALLVGLSYAKGLSFSISKPLIGVHHIEGHICANYLESADYSPPFVCLVVSGGHTNLIMVNGYDDIEVIGKTRDDAAGEAYDKVARALGLSYPGGPAIDSLAGQGSNTIDFPRAYLDNYDFSFSGLKSNVLNYLNKCRMKGIEINKADVAHSFQAAVVEVLVNKAVKLCKERKCPKIALAGGVASNSALRR